MSTLFATMLSAHIILGLVGLMASYSVLMLLLKKEPSQKMVLWSSAIAALSYTLSWFAGGYYYVLYYGDNVKPVIKEGMYPWAHLVFMEWKEHIFLVLPVVSVTLVVAIWFWNKAGRDPALKSSLVYLAGILVILATLVTLSGIVISGGAR